MLKQFKNADIRFSYSEYTVVPEIPRVIDVLYAMKLSEEQHAYDFCVGNHPIYIANIGLVMAAVAVDVLCEERYDETVAKKTIAEAIVNLCPSAARCLFVSAYVEARELIDESTPDVTKLSRVEQILACRCRKCVRRIEDEGIGRKVASNGFRPLDNLPQTDQCAPPGGTCWVTGLVDCDGAHG